MPSSPRILSALVCVGFLAILCCWAAHRCTLSPYIALAPPSLSIILTVNLMGVPETFPALAKEDLEIQPASVRYEYDPWLLDDHPLRSHPTECIPGLGTFLGEWLTSLQRRWKEALFRAGCLLLACL